MSTKKHQDARVERMQNALRAMGIEPGNQSVAGMKKTLENLGIPVVSLNQFAPHHKKNPKFAAFMRRKTRTATFLCGHPKTADNVVLGPGGRRLCKACKNH